MIGLNSRTVVAHAIWVGVGICPCPSTRLHPSQRAVRQVCFRRNVHGRQLAELQAAARVWEPAPPAFPLLDVAGLLQGEARVPANQV